MDFVKMDSHGHPTANSRRDALVNAIAFLAFIALACGAFWRLLLPGALVFGDNPMHQAEIHRLVNDVIPNQGWCSGWSFDDFAGYPLYLYHYVLGPYLVALSSAVTGASVESAYKFWVIGSFAFAGWSLFLFLRMRPGAGPVWSFLLASLFLFMSPLPAFHALGMWNFTLGAGLFLWTWSSMIQLFESPTPARFVKFAVGVAAMPLAHPYVAISTLVIALALAITRILQNGRSGIREIATVAGAGIAGGALAAFYIIPFLTSRGWGQTPSPPSVDPGDLWGRTLAFASGFLNITFAWLDSSNFTEHDGRSAASWLWQARFELHLWGPATSRVFACLLIFAVPLAIRRWRERDFARNSALVIFLIIIFFQLQWWRSILPVNTRGTVLQNILEAQRLLPVAWLAGLFMIADLAPALARRPPIARWILYITCATGVMGGATFVAMQAPWQFATELQSGAGYTKIREGFDNLRKTAPAARGRLAVDTLFQQAPMELVATDLWCFQSHILSRIPVECGWPTFGAWCAGWLYPTAETALTEGGSFFGGPAARLSADELLNYSREFNIEKFWLRDGDFTNKMKAAGVLGEAEWRGSGLGIYPLREGARGYLAASSGPPITVQSIRLASGAVQSKFNNTAPRQNLHLSVSYHPCWRATLDGAALPIRKTALGLMEFDVPSPGDHHLEMVFDPPRRTPMLISLIAAAALGVLLLKSRRAQM